MNKRRKLTKELKEKIIPKLDAEKLAENPEEELKTQGVYRAQEIFKELNNK